MERRSSTSPGSLSAAGKGKQVSLYQLYQLYQLTSSTTAKNISKKRDTLPNYRDSKKANQPLMMAGVDKLHAEGIKGKGAQIGLLDTGIDYHHPALGGRLGPGFKIVTGYDMVGVDYTVLTLLSQTPWQLGWMVDMGLALRVCMSLTRFYCSPD